MYNTFRFRILSVIAGIIFASVLIMWYSVQRQSRQTISSIQSAQASNLIKAIITNIESAYRGIVVFRDRQFEIRKKEISNIVNVAVDILENLHDKALAGKISEQAAKNLAINALRNMRYNRGADYLWINDTQTPYPMMIMHSFMPELEGTIMDSLEYNCALGRQANLFKAFRDKYMQYGHGYVDYIWPRQLRDGSIIKEEKISYIKLFKPWQWMIGTGIYIGDIQEYTRLRTEAVIEEIQETSDKIKIGDNGYLFIFSGDDQILIHPQLKGLYPEQVKKSEILRNLLKKMKIQAHSEQDYFDYNWEIPGDPSGKDEPKRVYVRHFKPLDWYVCASYYMTDINKPVNAVNLQLFCISAIFIIIALVIAFFLSKSISAPLRELAAAAEVIDREGLSAACIPITGPAETQELGAVLSNALKAIRANENSLVESSEKLRITLDAISDAVIATDINGRITRMNLNAEKITAWTENDAIGHELTDGVKLLDSTTGYPVDNPINLVLKDGKSHRLQRNTVLENASGDRFLINDSCSPILSDDQVVGAVIAFRDVTEQSRLEAELLQAQKMDSLGQLAGGVAHDFNNMLAGIMASAELLDRKIPDDNVSAHKFAGLITDSCYKAAGLTEKLLAFSRKGKIMSTSIHIDKVINDAISILEHSLPGNIKLQVHMDMPCGIIIGDPVQLQNMIINLAVNGSHAMPDGGTLHIKAVNVELDEDYCEKSTFELCPGNFVELEVKDSGEGISPENIPKIFEPFFTTKQPGKGTGLGLAAVYGSVKEHHGDVCVEST
ncbi:MAG: cache domain-containing protein, partial [Victivallales bacterium]|nr:cache domain-containing protein [Victivallales bacterium]